MTPLESPEEEPAPEWEDERRFVDADIAAGMETIGSAWIFAVIPIVLVMILLKAVMGSLVRSFGSLAYVLPTLPVLAMLLVPVWYRWRSPMPIHLRGKAPLIGRDKKRALIKGGLAMTAMTAVYYYGGPVIHAILMAFRDWLLQWRI